MQNIQAIILAAGKGTRLNHGKPSPIPKAMFELDGKPMVTYIVETLNKLGINKPIMVVGYKKEIIEKYFGDKCEYAWQEEQIGTGDAARQGVKKLDENIKSVLVLQCDDSAFYKSETLEKLIKCQQENNAAIVVITTKKSSRDLGRVVKDKNGQVQKMIEKEFMTEELYEKYPLINCAGYCFDANWAKNNFPKLQINKLGRLDITDMIELADSQNKKVLDLEISSKEWIGINTLEQYEDAKKMMI